MKTEWSALTMLLVLFVGLATLYNAAVPLGEGPDELGHAGYVFFLAHEGRVPVQCTAPCESDVPGEGHQPPLAYLLALPAVAWLPTDEQILDWPGNARFVWAGGDQVNALAHGSRELWPWHGKVLAWHLVRGVSTLWGALTVLFVFLAARRLLVAAAFPAALVTAFNPQMLFTAAIASNDALLIALGAVLVWLLLGRDSGGRQVAAIGVTLGLALITKQRAVIFVPLGLLWCVLHGRRHPTVILGRGAGIAAIVFILAGWWYLRNMQLYGDLLGLAVFKAEFTTQAFDSRNPQAWLAGFNQLFASFWGRFGWMNVVSPLWMTAGYALLTLAALGGLLIAMRRGTFPQPIWPLLLLPLLAMLWLVAFALTAGLVAWQGRLIFPALPALAILLGVGLATLLRPAPQPLAAVLVLLLLLPAAWAPQGVIAPAYPRHALSATQAQERIEHETFARFARYTELGAEVRGWSMTGDLRPGATLDIGLIWHALSYQNRDWQVFVQLLDGRTLLAEDMREPADGAFPMTQWMAGDWIETRHRLEVPADLAPGAYTLKIGLADPAERRRAAYFNDYDVNDPEGDSYDLAVLTITP